MKKLCLLIFMIYLSGLTFSCVKPDKHIIEYSLTSVTEIPNSLKQKHMDWISLNIKNSNLHTSFNRVKNQSDIIRTLRVEADELFGKQVLALQYYPDKYTNAVIVKQEDFNENQKVIFDELLKTYKY